MQKTNHKFFGLITNSYKDINIVKNMQLLLLCGMSLLFWMKYRPIVNILNTYVGINGESFIRLFLFFWSFLFILLSCSFTITPKVLLGKEKNILIINIILCFVFLLIYDYRLYHNFYDRLAHYNINFPILLYLADIVFGIALVASVKLFSIKRVFLFGIIIYMCHSMLSIYYFPYDYKSTDMLAAINIGITSFLQGVSPYKQIYPYIGAVAYFPLTWMAFIPAYFVGSITMFQIYGTLIIVCGLYLIYKNFDQLPMLNQLLIILVFLNPHFVSQNDLYFQFFILMLVTISLYLTKLNHLKQLILLILFSVTYQFAWLSLPFYILQISKSLKAMLFNIFSIMLAFVLIVYFTSNRDIVQFINSTFSLHGQDIFDDKSFSELTFGLSNLFFLLKLRPWLIIVQTVFIIGLGVLGLLKWIRYKSSYNFMALAALTYLMYIATNFYIMQYMYFPALIALALVNCNNTGRGDANSG